MAKIINVAVGILQQNCHVLLNSRPDDKSHAGYWEFPGGKIETGEDEIIAVIRELDEELGILVNPIHCMSFASIEQIYEHGIVRLSLVLVNSYIGIPREMEAQNLYWQNINSKCDLSPLLPTTSKILKIIHDYLNKEELSQNNLIV